MKKIFIFLLDVPNTSTKKMHETRKGRASKKHTLSKVPASKIHKYDK